MSFNFGGVTTTTSSTFGTATPSAGFAFGGGDQAKTTLFGSPNTGASDNKPAFNFTSPTGGFAFGAKTTAATTSLFTSPAATGASTAFSANKSLSFGAPPNQTVGSPGFGQPQQQATQPQSSPFALGQQSSPAPAFGSPATQASTFGSPTASFAFGKPAATTATTGFGFSTPATGFGAAQPTVLNAASPTPQSSQQSAFGGTPSFGQNTFGAKPGGFSFSGNTAPPASAAPAFGVAGAPAQAQTRPTLGFGAPQTQAPGLTGFGTPAGATTTTAQSSFSFNPTSQPNAFGTQPASQPSQSPLSFGTANSQPAGFGTQPTSQPASFGTQPTSQPASFGTQPTSQPAGFGTQPTSQPAGFGAQPTSQPAGFGTQPSQPAGFGAQLTSQPAGFGAQPTSQPAGFGTQPSQPAGFGTQPSQPAGFGTQPTSQPAGFGAQPTSQPAGFGAQPSQPAGFGAQPTSQPAGFGAQPTSQPSLGFGNQTSSQPTGFGLGTQPASQPAGLGFGTSVAQATPQAPTFSTPSATAQPSTGLSFGTTPATSANKPLTLTGGSLSLAGVATSTPASGLPGFGTTTSTASQPTIGLPGFGVTPASSASQPSAGIGFGTTPATTGLTGFSTGTGLGFGIKTTAVSSVAASTTAPSGITALGTLGKSTAGTTMPSLTTITTIAAAPPQPISSITFTELEENINKWTLELEEQEKTFINQATQVNAWDRLLIANGEKIVELNDAVETVKNEQQNLEHELDFVLAQQKELEDLLAPMEKHILENQGDRLRDPEREHMYSLAENLDTQLRQMSEDLKEVIEHLNETNRGQDSNDPIVQIGRILNTHMSSMQWVDNSIAQISNKLDQLKATHDTLRRDNERSFQLTYN